MESPWISIIIPCYNVQDYIDRCVKSLVTQTIGIEHLELLFVDDASTDGTVEKLKEWEKKYPDNILIVCCEQNGRQGTARNIGLQYASAPYIGFVDADDWVETDMYEKLYCPICHYQADLSVCYYKRDSGTKELKMGSIGKENEYFEIKTLKDRKVLWHMGMGSGVYCKLYRRSLLLDNRIYFPEGMMYEDNYFGAILRQYVRSIVYVKEYLYHYFVNKQSTTVTKNARQHYIDRLQIEEMVLQEYIAKGWIKDFYAEEQIHFIKMYYINTLHILFSRFDAASIPSGLVQGMRKRVLELFPDYAQNPLWGFGGGLKEHEQILYDSLADELTEEKVGELRKKYLDYIRGNRTFANSVDY